MTTMQIAPPSRRTAARVLASLDALTILQRQVFVLHGAAGLSVPETGRQLGLKWDQVSGIYAAACQRLTTATATATAPEVFRGSGAGETLQVGRSGAQPFGVVAEEAEPTVASVADQGANALATTLFPRAAAVVMVDREREGAVLLPHAADDATVALRGHHGGVPLGRDAEVGHPDRVAVAVSAVNSEAVGPAGVPVELADVFGDRAAPAHLGSHGSDPTGFSIVGRKTAPPHTGTTPPVANDEEGCPPWCGGCNLEADGVRYHLSHGTVCDDYDEGEQPELCLSRIDDEGQPGPVMVELCLGLKANASLTPAQAFAFAEQLRDFALTAAGAAGAEMPSDLVRVRTAVTR